jgi:hypothetical protein
MREFGEAIRDSYRAYQKVFERSSVYMREICRVRNLGRSVNGQASGSKSASVYSLPQAARSPSRRYQMQLQNCMFRKTIPLASKGSLGQPLHGLIEIGSEEEREVIMWKPWFFVKKL